MSQNQLHKQCRYFESKIVDRNVTYTPVVLSDSKAHYLKNEVTYPAEKKLVWWYEKGATAKAQLDYLKDNLELKLHKYPKIVLYIWLGTCNLTKKEGKFIQLRARDNSAVSELIDTYKQIRAFVSGFPTVKLAYLELPYYSIFHWNASRHHDNPGTFKHDDFVLNEQIDRVNSFIRESNLLLRKHSPQFNCDIQNCRKDRGCAPRYTIKFYNFFNDGIHPCPALARLWLLRICEIALKDCA